MAERLQTAAPARAETLLQAVATVHLPPQPAPALVRDLTMLASAAADQLSQAWGARRRKNGRT